MTPEITWWELSVTVPSELADDLCGLLLYHGALGAELNIPSLQPPPLVNAPPRDENASTLLASYDAELSREAVLCAAAEALQAARTSPRVPAAVIHNKVPCTTAAV